MTPPVTESVDPRRRWALLLVPVVLGLHWYVARPDMIGVRTEGGWRALTPLALGPQPSFIAVFVLLGVLPAVLAVVVLHWRAGSLGLLAGRARRGLVLTGIGVPVAIAAGWLGAQSSALDAVYPLGVQDGAPVSAIARHAGAYLLYYAGLEFFFRGYLLLGVFRPLGPRTANVLQAVLATLMHFGRPGGEFLAALPGSLVFGWLTQRTGSIWYAAALHWVVGVSLDMFLLGG